MANERKLIGSPFQRGVNETRPYRIDVSVWGAGTYASPAVTILDEAGARCDGRCAQRQRLI
jgi:hypothetical protein